MTKTRPKALLTLLLLFSIQFAALPQLGYSQATSQASAVDYSNQLQKIEEKVEARRKELGIPGMSLAIVKDDKVIYAKGLGYKDYENKAAVTPDTQFAIGSATKAFTALSVLMTADEGKLSLDDSPKRLLPYFKMYDAETDKNITIRDLMCHSSGLNRTDLAMITGKLTRAELIQVSAQAKPTAKLREKFQYQNIMYTAAGELVTQAQKQAWEKFVPERIFKPLGMTNSTMSMKQMSKAADRSLGYDYNFDTKETKQRPYREIDQVAPAGSINSSARDMAEWVRFVLGGGSVNGRRLVSQKGFDEWLKPQMKMNAAGTVNYALGWMLRKWNGLSVVEHGGNIDGFNSLVAMIPEKKLGFVMLTNVTASSMGNDLMPIIWSNLIELPKTEAVKLPLKTMQFMVGKYRLDEAAIDIEVKIVGEDLVMVVPGQPQYTLERFAPRQFKPVGAPDGFSVKFTPEQGDATEMELTQPNRVSKLTRIAAGGPAPISGTPKPADLNELIGRYEFEANSLIAEIKEVDGKVSMAVTGQSAYPLVEKSKDVYGFTGLPDSFSMRIGRDGAGKVTKIITSQPGADVEWKRLAGDSKPAITADELMSKAIDAAGGETAWRKLTSRVTTFSLNLENQGVQGYGKVYSKAPNMSATETTMTALGKKIATGWEYFDGQNGADDYTFMPAAEKYTGTRLDDVKIASDFYGILNWKSHFKTVLVKAKGMVGDDECWIVEFTPTKGTTFTEYYSTKTFLLRKREGVITSSTNDLKIPYSMTFDDYRNVDGVKVAFKTTANNIGNGNIVTTFTEVKHDVKLDDKMFAPRKP